MHQSVHDFEEFLKHIKRGEFVKEKALALKWVSEVKKEIVASH